MCLHAGMHPYSVCLRVYCISITWVDRSPWEGLSLNVYHHANVMRWQMQADSAAGSWERRGYLQTVSRGFYLQTVPHSKARVWSRQFSSLTWPCFFWNDCAYRYCITVIQYNTGDFEYDWHEMQADSASSIWESRPVVLHLQHNTCTSCTASATQDVYCICSTRLLLLHLQQNWLCQMNMKLTLSMIDMRCKLILPLAFEKVF